jgi:VCBS repeat-containing protein
MRRLLLILLLVFPAYATTIHVEGPQDSLAQPPQDFTMNHCTFRKALVSANDDSAALYPQCVSGSGVDTIVFDAPAGSPWTITTAIARADQADAADNGDYNITQSLIIEGDGTTFDAAQLDRVFHVSGPFTVVTLRNLWIRNGRGVEGGGGILVDDGATLNLENVTISGCNASAEDGGGIKVMGGATVHMTNCTISGNSTAVHGGGIAIDDSQAHVVITSCTITGNQPGFSNTTAGIHNTGNCTLRNTIVSGNGSASGDLPSITGIFTSDGYNIIDNLGKVAGNPQITATTGDQFGTSASPLTASVHLGPLQNNGGFVPTHELQTGSIAIDQGHSSGSTTDARGLTRPCDIATIANATGGDGGDVGAFEVQGACAAANTNPDALDDSASVNRNSSANAIDVLANDSDADGDALTVTAVTQGAHGAVVNNGTSVSYTPAAAFSGGDSFTYTISDGHGGTDTATVSVTIVNHPPVANADSYTVNQDTLLHPAAPGVLANDTDADSDSLSAQLVSTTAHGTLALSANGSFTYMGNAHFTGTDSFTYRASDGDADSNSATVTIHVLDTEPPVINASVATAMLWPPDHDLVNVGFNVSATDNGSGPITTAVQVLSNEDDVTGAGGDQSPDAKSVGAGTLRLRAERSATGNGRFYLIRVTATDASMNASHKCVAVVVPKSLSAADVGAINAQASAAAAACTATGLFPVGDGPRVGPKQ